MTNGPEEEPPADRKSPVGKPVVRGDETINGAHGHGKRRRSIRTTRRASTRPLKPSVRSRKRGPATKTTCTCCAGRRPVRRSSAASVSYKGAAERAGGETTVAFIRKWARVHDLPRSIRRPLVSLGRIAPTAAKHIARVDGDARYQLAWAILDNSLTVREVRAVVSDISDGADAGTRAPKARHHAPAR